MGDEGAAAHFAQPSPPASSSSAGGAQAYVDSLAAAFNAASMAQAAQQAAASLDEAAAAPSVALPMPGGGSFVGGLVARMQPPSSPPAGAAAIIMAASPPLQADGRMQEALLQGGGGAAPAVALQDTAGAELAAALCMQGLGAADAAPAAAAAAPAGPSAFDGPAVAQGPRQPSEPLATAGGASSAGAAGAAAPNTAAGPGPMSPEVVAAAVAPGLTAAPTAAAVTHDLDAAAAAAAAAATAAAPLGGPLLGPPPPAPAMAAVPAATLVLPAAAVPAAALAAVPAAVAAAPAAVAPAAAAALAQAQAQQPAQQPALLSVSPPAGAEAAGVSMATLSGAPAPAGTAAAAAATAAGLNAPLLMAAGLSTATALMPTGATPAQLATGMPAVQAVPVIVTSQQAGLQGAGGAALSQAFSSQTLDPGLGSLTASTLGLASLGGSSSTLQGPTTVVGSPVGSLMSASTPALPSSSSSTMASAANSSASAAGSSMSAGLACTLTKLAVAQQQQQAAAQQVQQQQAMVAALVSSGTDASNPALGSSLVKLAVAQQQQQQAAATTATLQAAAAAAAVGGGLLAAGAGVAPAQALGGSCPVTGATAGAPGAAGQLIPGTSLTSNLSNLSLSNLSNLRSASVASSVLSGPPTSSSLEPIRSITGSGSTSSSTRKVRVLLSSGGEYEELPPASEGSGSRSARWRYVGGETRLVGLSATSSYSAFLQQLSKATSAVWDESCRLMYDLPSSSDQSGLLVDLIDDEDLEMMWEELEAATAANAAYRLHIYVQLGCKRSSTGAVPSSIASEEHSSDDVHSASTPQAAAVAAATAAAAAAAGSAANSGGSGGGGAGTPRRSSGSGSGGGPAASSSGGSGSGKPAATAAASAGAGAGAAGSGATVTSSELEDLVEDIVTERPLLNLTDLESRLEIIRPEELQPVRLLGSGGFGEVYLCRWHSCEVAVKCLNPNLLVPDGAMGSFSKDNVSELLKEASMLGSVRHPNIVWVYGLVMPPLDAAVEAARQGLGPGQGIDAVKVATQMANRHRTELAASAIRPPALVTEFLASGSLRAAIMRRADFVLKDSVRIKLALDAARGMDYLHAKHIVHFDLKTANLLVGMRDKVPICKVADFGLSKQKQQTFVTGVATLRGTLPWIAPEIIKTPSGVTEAVDVYSFGIVLWELWTLREPFEGINYHALLHMMSTSSDTVRPAMPGSPEFEGEDPSEPAPGWRDLVNSCLAAQPDDRPTFKALVERLEGMLRQNRLAKKRSASGPPAPGVDATPATSTG